MNLDRMRKQLGRGFGDTNTLVFDADAAYEEPYEVEAWRDHISKMMKFKYNDGVPRIINIHLADRFATNEKVFVIEVERLRP